MVRQCAWCLYLLDADGVRIAVLPLPPLYEATHGMCSVCGKLWMDQWLGKEKNLRLLRCGYCRTTFSERPGTALEEARLPAAEVEKLVAHRQAGCGMRRTARLTGQARSPVAHYAVVAGAPARAGHDEAMRALQCAEIPADEQWACVGKKRGAR